MWLMFLILPSYLCSTVVHTPYGDIEGFEHQTEKGVPTQVFLGIRYGKATNGSRRFQKPELIDKWAPNRLTAQQFGPSCDGFTGGKVPNTTYSEDCLSLNIITPKSAGGHLPVFFYIHGGFYEVGSSASLGYERLAEKFATEGIVVVTINYRLGPFGFFSLGDSSAAGNLGLWDQTLALRFAREILPSFGGDPSRITIGGHSAGAASASALQFSPHSSSLFSQSILLSGSSLAEFAQSEMVVDESKKLLGAFGCPRAPTKDALDCLRRFTPDEIIKAAEKIGSTRRHPNVVKYNPRIDGDFFPQSIAELGKTAPKKRVLAGATDQESALFVMNEVISWLAGISLTKAEKASFSRKELVEFIETVVVTDKEHGKSAPTFRRLLVDFYAGNESVRHESKFYLQRYTDLNSDLQFFIPLYQEVQLNLAHDWPTYLYILQHETKSFPRESFAVKGTHHGDELEHFTNSHAVFALKKNEADDRKFGENFVSAMVNFIKNGDPTNKPAHVTRILDDRRFEINDPSSSSFAWPPVTIEHPLQHASITVNVTFKREAYRAKAARLWLDTIPQSVPTEILRNTRLPGA